MRLIAALLLVAFPIEACAEGWLCVAEIENGFNYNFSIKSWQPIVFKATNKYVIKRSDNPDYKWVVVEVGASFPSYFCEEDFTEDGNLMCDRSAIRFNKNLLRFAAASTYPYFAQLEKFTTDEPPDSMWMGAGLCTAI